MQIHGFFFYKNKLVYKNEAQIWPKIKNKLSQEHSRLGFRRKCNCRFLLKNTLNTMLQTSHENFLRKTVFQYTGRRLNPIWITNMFTGPAELLWKWWGWLATQSRGAENTFSPPPCFFLG